MAPNSLHPLGQGAGGGSLPGIYPAVERSGHWRRGRTPGATYVGTPPGSNLGSKEKREKLSTVGCVTKATTEDGKRVVPCAQTRQFCATVGGGNEVERDRGRGRWKTQLAVTTF